MMAPSKSTLLPLLAALPYASAWGFLGHTTVAYVAQHFVCEKTAKFAQHVLNDTTSAYLANVATWADTFRLEPGEEWSAHLHYIDALDNPPKICNVVYERDCPEDGCIHFRYRNYSSRAVQKKIGAIEQQEALKWVIHFLGDIHQPLHVENLALGGNLINVTFDGVKTNLHAIWDTAIPQKEHGNFSQVNALAWAKELTSEIKHGIYKKESRTWLKGLNVKDAIDSAVVWANDANKYVCTTVIPNGPDAVSNKELAGAYYKTAIPVVSKQIAKAGYRLAAWLDAMVEAAEKGGHDHWKGGKHDKRADFKLQPWMEEARQARRDFGGDCGCGANEHSH